MTREEQLRWRFMHEEPLAQDMGAVLLDLEVGYAVIEVPIVNELMIREQIVQGGIGVVVADFAGVYAAMMELQDAHAPARQMHFYLERPILATDGVIRAEARVVNTSASSITVEVVVVGPLPDRKVRTRGTIMFMRPKSENRP